MDSLALLGTSTIEINQLRRDLVKHKLPDLLFGDEINKRISQLFATNCKIQTVEVVQVITNAIIKAGSKNIMFSKNFQAPRRSSAQGSKGYSRQSKNCKKRN